MARFRDLKTQQKIAAAHASIHNHINQGRHLKRMMPWLLGQKANGSGAGKQDVQRLLHTYVAMTRPSHLLCLAIPRSALGDDQVVDQTVATLKERGWHVAEIVEGVAQWLD
jgi:hypothetical protein